MREMLSLSSLFFIYLFSLITLISSQEVPVVVSVLPNQAPSTGGQSVEVTGMLFSNEFNPTCRFGSILVTAKFLSSTIISCITPPASDSSYTVSVEVSNDGVTFSNAGKQFYYYAVFSISPVIGEISDHTKVTVSGINFGPFSYCKFGNATYTNAVYVNLSTLICDSPLGDPKHRHVPLEVSVLVGSYTNNGVEFEFLGEFPPPPQLPIRRQYEKLVIFLSTSGILFVFALFMILGWYVTRPRHAVLSEAIVDD